MSTLLAESKCALRFKDGTTINHLFYMDDMKLDAKTERDIDSLINLPRVFSDDIGMSFGLSKCGRLMTKRGKVVGTNGVALPNGHIADIEQG